MYVLVTKMMSQVRTCVEYLLCKRLLLHIIVKHGIIMAMLKLIPRDPLLCADHHQSHPEISVANAVVASTLQPLDSVLTVALDVRIKLLVFFHIQHLWNHFSVK